MGASAGGLQSEYSESSTEAGQSRQQILPGNQPHRGTHQQGVQPGVELHHQLQHKQ